MLKELFTTDVGLVSLAVIIVAIVIGLVTARFLIKNSGGDSSER